MDSRTGRMKAHQVSGGAGGAKPPEKGKGEAHATVFLGRAGFNGFNGWVLNG